jgi:TPR repeat protein
MRKTGSIKNLRGIVPALAQPVSIAEMDEAIGEHLALDDMRIRREWRKGHSQMPKTVPEKTENLHLRAHMQWDAGNKRAAFRLMSAAAKSGGDIGAMLNLGYFYDVGIGVKRNRKAAMYCYQRAYRRGFASAAVSIGTIYRDENRTRRALKWFGRALAMGDVDVKLEIARIYIDDLKTPEAAVPHLHRVIGATERVGVIESSREEALLLLQGIERDRKNRKPVK